MADLLIPFIPGQDLTAAVLNAAFDVTRIKYQVTDQQVNNTTTLASSSNLVFALAATSTYIFEAGIKWDSSTTADFKAGLALPAGTTVLISPWGSDTTSSGASATITHDSTTSVTWSYSGNGAGSVMSAKPDGVITTVGSSGNLTFQFAQNTAAVSNTILKTGSWIRLTKVA